MPRTLAAPGSNRLLDRLSSAARERVLGACEVVALTPGDRLGEAGEPVQHVYFPANGAIASFLAMDTGRVIEVGLVGHEGLHGAAAARGGTTSQLRADVRLAGAAWRMPLGALRDRMSNDTAFAAMIDAYVGATTSQLVRSAGCNRFHRVEERVARSFLMMADRARLPLFPATHELVGRTLGVRRAGVTNAAGDLQRRKLIAYDRGVITILDRAGLERASCDCYREDLAAYGRALPKAKRRAH